MKNFCIFLLTLIMFNISCPAFGETQLEIREYQTRTYDNQDTKSVMKAVINTLQDEGFTISNSDTNLGFLTAKKEFQLKKTSKGLVTIYSIGFVGGVADAIFTFGILSYVPVYYAGLIAMEIRPKHFIINCTANVSEFGSQSKIRITFTQKMFGKRDGQVAGKKTRIKTEHIKDRKFYQNFFTKIDKSLFIEKEKI